MKTTYHMMVVPGISGIATQEMSDRFGVRVSGTSRVRNADLIKATYSGNPKDLLALRTVEDVFVALGSLKLTGQLSDMKALATASWWGAPLREALAMWSQTTGKSVVKRLQFRVVVQADDVAWRHYRRQELMLAGERAMMNAGASWRLSRDEAPLEIWLQQSGKELLASVRLSTGEMRQHGGREAERGAALRPSVAAAMVRLSQPVDNDVFLDPMCGTGTILLERAQVGRYGLLLGGDIEQAAVDAALVNFGPRHQPRRVECWDATKLPLEDSSVGAMACNLPWGRQIGEQAALPALYGAVLREMARVAVPGARVVLLTSEWNILKRVIHERPELRLVDTVTNIEILGRRADMFVLMRV